MTWPQQVAHSASGRVVATVSKSTIREHCRQVSTHTQIVVGASMRRSSPRALHNPLYETAFQGGQASGPGGKKLVGGGSFPAVDS
jgi:hypothetical protein